jgi:hypothetical protein
VGRSVLVTVGSLIAGGVVAVATIVGLVHSQTSASGQSPADVNQPVTINYGSTS